MAEKSKDDTLQEERLKMAVDMAPRAQEEAFKAPAVGSQSPSLSIRGGTPTLRHRQPSNFNRSLGRSSRRSGHWMSSGMDTARLSMGWGSTRRKGLKEILLQSSQAKPAWLSASRNENGGDVDAEELSPEDLSLALDPLEHEWMLTVAHGDIENALHLLEKDPSLLIRKDFVTGFTVLHWLAKHGQHEDLIQVVSFAERNHCPVDINVLTASGRLTPLHLAALQGREMVMKVLVGAFGADVGLRDHNGRKAWQCLRADAPRELKELLGASEEDLATEARGNVNNNNCVPSRRGGLGNALKVGSKEPQSQRVAPRLSYFRNVFKQAVAFFQEL
nr:ankyrin repeat domain-containing protein SOWAHD [Anolis sagrei ordinatus]